jgi:hypothetical protein
MIFANAAPGVEYATSDNLVSAVAPDAPPTSTSATIAAKMALRTESPC